MSIFTASDDSDTDLSCYLDEDYFNLQAALEASVEDNSR